MAKKLNSSIHSEIKRRAQVKRQEKERPKFEIESFCFDKQIAFIRDPAKFKTAVCSRRAGKTVSCAADLINTVVQYEGDVAYITLNRRSAKRIIWRDLLKINKDFELGGKPDNVDLTLTFEKGTIHVSGAKDEAEIEKIRGMAFRKVYIDEAQSFRPYIENLVDDVLVPALYDYDGSLCLIGTPGPISAGYFFDASHNIEWSNHRWTIFNNPHIERKSGKKVSELLAAERKRRGIDESDPTYQRESLGRWVHDSDALVYKFDRGRNIYKSLPKEPLEYIMGIDIGYHDADAVAILGYNSQIQRVFLVEEWVANKQNISKLVVRVNKLRSKYNPTKIVMDTGGLGKKIAEEMITRYQIPVHAAEKKRKFEFIELLNDDLRTGRLQTFDGSRFEEDSYLVQWDRSSPERLRVSDNYHTDIGDAVLYAWRECHHYIKQDIEFKPLLGTDEYMDRMEEEEASKMQRRKDDPDWQLAEAYEADVNAIQRILDEDW